MISFSGKSRWRPAKRSHKKELQHYLMQRESRCVTVTERIKHESGRNPVSGRYLIYDGPSGIEGCVYYTAGGFVYPVLSEGALPDRVGLKTALNALGPRLFCVMGTQRDVLNMEAVFSRPALTHVSYYLMERQLPVAASQSVGDGTVRIRRAELSDAESIYPIQRLYELEEVLIDPAQFDPDVCMKQLRVSLKKQAVYVATTHAGIVAKAQTNARGFGWDQIGGVFTRESFRSRGIGKLVMRALLSETDTEERRTSLFVKTHNAPALRMYRTLQYTTTDEFRITYYRNV
ncbi:MAG: GNAT family N-acetyltransferase [Spirochaetaceae bacterium]|nr:MAG: GNAT family N-acetyltransferase [Spirochaetaceae bacterium]